MTRSVDRLGAPPVASSDSAPEYFERTVSGYGGERAPGGGLWHRHFLGRRREIALDWLDLPAGAVVVDVGAGPGPLTGALRDRGCRVVAVDRSRAMLARAREGGARAIVGDACAVPLRDATCNAAVALGLASYVEDLPGLLRELGRLVRPGGRVVVSVAVRSAPDWWMRRALRAPARAAGVRGLLTSGLELQTWRRTEWRAAVTAAGLELVEERGHDFTLFPLSRLLPGPSVSASRAVETLDLRALDRAASEVVLHLRVPGPVERVPPVRRRPRVLRLIARLNVGGPAWNAVLLTRGLAARFDTVLATGQVGPGEVEATATIAAAGVVPERVRGLGRAPSLVDDVRAFFGVLALTRRVRPDVVHTHTAKAGALGRVAAWLCGVPRVVHTFHGHVFHGYFGSAMSRVVVAVERALARRTDRVLAVSAEIARDVSDRYRVAPSDRVRVTRIGLPLARLSDARQHRAAVRAELGVCEDTPVAVMLGRLVPVKEPEVALDAWEIVRRALPSAALVVVGGGPLLESVTARRADGVHLLGWRDDIERWLGAADVALLTSRNEGTPVALIEAGAAGLPSVATRVGGVPSVVLDGETGMLVERGDAAALAAALVRLFEDGDLRLRMGTAARRHVTSGWSEERLLADVSSLYRTLLVAPPR